MRHIFFESKHSPSNKETARKKNIKVYLRNMLGI